MCGCKYVNGLSRGVLSTCFSPWFSFRRKSAGSDAIRKHPLVNKKDTRVLHPHSVRQISIRWLIAFIERSRKCRQICRDRKQMDDQSLVTVVEWEEQGWGTMKEMRKLLEVMGMVIFSIRGGYTCQNLTNRTL